ncbi:MAG TPA: oxidoreductase [Chloroflexota bacterium]|nr:oxidoreductase [Chloroflexota bacterium]
MVAVDTFRALVVDNAGAGVALGVQEWSTDRLMAGEVTIRVAYSSVNYKDGLAVRADGRVVRNYPLIPGIDLAGTVESSADGRFKAGDRVLAHGYEIGVAHHGGLAEVARVPADWVVPLPSGLTARQAMALGTAGFTAALSVAALEAAGLKPGTGPVIVTGASGGVGSTAVDILAALGYEVAASTGSAEAHEYLRSLGAGEILDRTETSAESARPLERGRWAGAVDAVGGATLAYLLRTMNYGASVAISGNAGGIDFSSTVFPFILRAVNVLGIDSVAVPIEKRVAVWERLASDLRPPHLDDAITHEIALDQAPDALEKIVRGEIQGRTVVRVAG